jgi:hypothetical protein
MKSTAVSLVILVASVLFAGPVSSAEPSKTVRGKVIAVDPDGKGIVVEVGSGKGTLDVGAIVQDDTKLTVGGKNRPVSELNGIVREGDTVTLKYAKTDDLDRKSVV